MGDVEAPLRRIALGFRAVGVAWLVLLSAIAVADGAPAAPLLAGGAVAAAWTVVLARRWSRSSRPGIAWTAADAAVAVAVLAGPPLAGAPSGLAGGWPFGALVLAAVANGIAGAVAVAALLVGATLLAEGSVAPGRTVQLVVFHLAAAGMLGWGVDVLRRADAERRAAMASLAEERAARARALERAETAAHLHDSVLQTLALVQRRASDPAAVAALARSQERALRTWLDGGSPSAATFKAALAAVVDEVEAAHAVRVGAVVVGDAPLTEPLSAVVAAAGEALRNAARHAGVTDIDVYAEVGGDAVEVFVRDRGAGFDPDAVGADRRGVRESIVGRLARHGGRAEVRSTPGTGTEVVLSLPVGAVAAREA